MKELEGKILTSENELMDTEAMLKKESNLRIDLERETRELKERLNSYININSMNSEEMDLKHQN
jgi:hypothetical protein